METECAGVVRGSDSFKPGNVEAVYEMQRGLGGFEEPISRRAINIMVSTCGPLRLPFNVKVTGNEASPFI